VHVLFELAFARDSSDDRAMLSDGLYARISMALGDLGLRAVGKLNVPFYRATRGRLFGRIGRLPVMLLTTTGRRSGVARTVPVVCMRDGERLVVIGSNAGNDRTPAWALNLIATPEAEVEMRGRRRDVKARITRLQEPHEQGHPSLRARAALSASANPRRG
jgi:F420H(2)-dependent quinone reductase